MYPSHFVGIHLLSVNWSVLKRCGCKLQNTSYVFTVYWSTCISWAQLSIKIKTKCILMWSQCSRHSLWCSLFCLRYTTVNKFISRSSFNDGHGNGYVQSKYSFYILPTTLLVIFETWSLKNCYSSVMSMNLYGIKFIQRSVYVAGDGSELSWIPCHPFFLHIVIV